MPAAGPLDRAALEQLYARLERPVYNVVYRRVWSAEDAHEVVQETFVRLWGMRARVRPETVEPLVYQVALNLASKRRRWQRLRTFLWLDDQRWPDDGAGVDGALADAERRAMVRAAVEALPDHLRDVVLLTAFSELSTAEVATALDIPPGTVGSRRNTAVKRLREELGGIDGLT